MSYIQVDNALPSGAPVPVLIMMDEVVPSHDHEVMYGLELTTVILKLEVRMENML